MNLKLKICLIIISFSFNNYAYTQDTFILNYEDVDIKKVTQDIARFSKKNNYS